MKWMHKARLGVGAVVAALSLSAAITGSALATGQPGAADGNHCGVGTAAETPGKASEARGSVFNLTPESVSGEHYAGNPETASLEHSKSGVAESQYDVACLNTTTH